MVNVAWGREEGFCELIGRLPRRPLQNEVIASIVRVLSPGRGIAWLQSRWEEPSMFVVVDSST